MTEPVKASWSNYTVSNAAYLPFDSDVMKRAMDRAAAKVRKRTEEAVVRELSSLGKRLYVSQQFYDQARKELAAKRAEEARGRPFSFLLEGNESRIVLADSLLTEEGELRLFRGTQLAAVFPCGFWRGVLVATISPPKLDA